MIAKTVILRELNSKGMQNIANKITSITRSGNRCIYVSAVKLNPIEYRSLKDVLNTYTIGSFDSMSETYIYNDQPVKEYSVRYAIILNTK